jgi:anti-anti-sigma factor
MVSTSSSVHPGTLLLRGELDIDTVQDLQDKIDKILAPRTSIILDLAQVSFLNSGAIHCFLKTWHATGHPVVLLNTSPAARRILDLATLEAEAWVFDGEGREMDGRFSTQELSHSEIVATRPESFSSS